MVKAKESYLVGKSFKSFLLATVLSSIITQVNIIVDGIMVGNFISPNAVSALNLAVPVSNFIFGITSLFCTGASMLAAKAIGSQDYKYANKIFTVATLSVIIVISIISIVGLIFLSDITNFLCPVKSLSIYLERFLKILIPGFVTSSLFTCFNGFVSVDGQPSLITKAVIGNAITNLLCDILFIKVAGWGISGAACATICGFVVGLVILGVFMTSKVSSFRFSTLEGNYINILKANMKQGIPILTGATIMSILFFAANSIVIQVQGAQGIFIMSVCTQLLMLGFIVFTGASQSIFSIGSLMIGENDIKGLRILIKDCFRFLLLSLLILTVYVIYNPQPIVRLFGCNNPVWLSASVAPIRIFILCLIPFGVIMIIKTLYQVLDYFKASMFFIVAPPAFLILLMWLISYHFPYWLWLAYPVSYLSLVFVAWGYSAVVRRKHPDYQKFTLIPPENEKKSMRQTVMYTNEDVVRVLNVIRDFLMTSLTDDILVNHALICCEELMYNIVEHATNEPDKHFFDVHTLVHDDKLTIIIKDDGKQFNPKFPYVRPTEEQLLGGDDLKLGLTLVNGLCDDINYKYMFGQNMLYLNFKR